jgi:tetrapyrrole methylase family protein/MazG family protein
MKSYLIEFEKLVSIMATLRSKNGCMWDKKQTYHSLIKHLFSEASELKKAVYNNDIDNLKEEIGDILLHIVFYSQIARENKHFNITDIIKNLNKKLIRRHPHIFADYKVNNVKDIENMWEEIKMAEKKSKSKSKRIRHIRSVGN